MDGWTDSFAIAKTMLHIMQHSKKWNSTLRGLLTFCTTPGKCTSIHPSKIANSNITLTLSFTILVRKPFLVARSRLWNSLPPTVTSAPMLTVIRNRLKTYLFSRSFSSCFRFPVLYTVYSSGSAVLYLSYSK